ncbi:MAG TPA: trypsin-like peptidase domain-containing protein [Opitutaceae bacterium]|nr:trypsin-like peptidase domain-containing protein [Opitutaceae bacterium]
MLPAVNVSGRSLFLGSFSLVLAGLLAGLWLSHTDAVAATLTNPPAKAPAVPEARPVAPRTDLGADEQRNIRLFEEASPSVVYITTVALQAEFFSRDIAQIPLGTGSGFIWDDSGHIITNFHVIQNADAARVTLSDRTTWDAKLVGVAPEKDLAVLKIDAPREKLHPIPLGASHDLRVGQNVFAIGNPFGLDQTLTVGIVSALGREIEAADGTPIRDVIQTDAAINPGNSGGPLLDSAGRLIGVNSAIRSPSGASAGIGFAIPVDAVNWVVPELISFGKLRRPSVDLEVANPYIARRLGIGEGLLVLDITPGGAAEKAGIQPTKRTRRGEIILGDVIVGIDGQPVRAPGDLRLALERKQPGETIQVTVVRNRREVTVALKLAEPR